MAPDRDQHVDPAVGSGLDERAARQAHGEVAPGVDVHLAEGGEHLDADRHRHGRQAAEAALLVLVEQLVRRMDRLRERRGRRHLGHPDQGDLHRHLLDQQRQPAAGTQQPADVVLALDEVDRVAPGLVDEPREQLDRRAGERLVGGRDPERAEPHHPAPGDGLEGAGRRQHPCLGGRGHHVGHDDVEVVDVDAVHDQPVTPAVERPLQRSLEGVARCDHDLELVEAGAQQLRQLGDAAGIDPGDVGTVADEGPHHGRLPAAREGPRG